MPNGTKQIFESLIGPFRFAFQNLQFAAIYGRGRLAWVTVLSVLQALAQLANVVSIAPVIGLATNMQSCREWLGSKQILSRLNHLSDYHLLLLTVGLLLAIAALSTLVNILAERSRARFVFGFSYYLRRQIIQNLRHRPYSYFVENNPSGIITVLQQYTEMYVSNVLLQILELVTRILMVILLSSLILATNWQIALVAGGFLVTTYIGIFVGLAKVRESFRECMIATGGATTQQATQYIQGIRTIRLQNAEEFFQNEYLGNCRDRALVMGRQIIVNTAPKYAMEFALFLVMSALILFTAGQPESFSRYLPSLALIGFATYRLMPILQQIYFCAGQISSNSYTFDQIRDEWSETYAEALPNASVPIRPMEFTRALRIENLIFRYPSAESDTLSGVDLTIQRGECLGICGSSGAGKSTFVDLLLGLQVPTAGRIVVDDVQLCPVNVAHWRSIVGYVPQDIFLIDDTIARNIAFGKASEEIDMSQVEHAARLAQIHQFICELPCGYNERVGDRGARLSGGQRQRIALARALYHNPKILIMDEATSALDNTTEEALIQAIDSLTGSLTIVMIAHRLTTLRNCDRVLVVSAGKLIAADSRSLV
jgi:ABC-type multidrug transport system fused ATPase/permease subunit